MPCFWYIILKNTCFQTPLFTLGWPPKWSNLTSGCHFWHLDLDLRSGSDFDQICVLDHHFDQNWVVSNYKRSLKNTFFDGSVPRTRQRTKKSEIFYFHLFRPPRGGGTEHAFRVRDIIFDQNDQLWDLTKVKRGVWKTRFLTVRSQEPGKERKKGKSFKTTFLTLPLEGVKKRQWSQRQHLHLR